MGFSRPNVELAMSKMKQNPIFACLWLCGEEINDVIEFEANSSIFEALQQSAVLQENLNDPKFFISILLTHHIVLLLILLLTLTIYIYIYTYSVNVTIGNRKYIHIGVTK